jgi:hypothetical protein
LLLIPVDYRLVVVVVDLWYPDLWTMAVLTVQVQAMDGCWVVVAVVPGRRARHYLLVGAKLGEDGHGS